MSVNEMSICRAFLPVLASAVLGACGGGATTPPPADTTPPTLASGLPAGTLPAGTAATTLSVTTSENATCRYATTAGTAYAAMTSTFATTGGTTHATTLTGLVNGQTYNRYVRCQDTAGNATTADYPVTFSVAGATGDTTAPSTPANLSATAVSNSQINLAWTASTDNVGVTGYRVERCQGAGCTSFTQVGTPTGTTYNDTGLSASTASTYRVRAADAAGNTSAYSGMAFATTQSGGGTGPTTQPLLTQSSLTYLGAFKLPTGTLGSIYGFPYAGAGGIGTYAVTYNPARNSLFIGGHPYEQRIAEIAIPVSLSGTPTATALTNLIDPLEGKLGSINPSDPNQKVLGSALVYNNQLYLGGFSFYDGAATQNKSQFVRPTNLSTTGQVVGPVKIGSNYPGWVDKYAALVPTEWQTLLGGPAIAGGSGGAINSLQSWGPSASIFNPSSVGSVDPVPAILELAYPYSHPLANTTIGNQYWSEKDVITGVVFPAGSRSVLYFGMHGLGNYCYGPGTSDPNLAGTPAPGGVDTWCYDPDDGSKGTHAYPYRSQVWAYDANDLLAVKNGTKNSYDVQPYAVWNLDSSFKDIQGIGYDSTAQRLYVSVPFGDALQPLIRVYQLQ